MDMFYDCNNQSVDITGEIKILEKSANEIERCTAWFLLGHIDIISVPPYRLQIFHLVFRKCYMQPKVEIPRRLCGWSVCG